MKLFYAVGGGLGHITRTITLMSNLNIPPEESILLSNSAYARSPFIPEKLKVIPLQNSQTINLVTYQQLLLQIIREFEIQEVFLDAFPTGILGEWNNFKSYQSLTFNYVARILQWSIYSQKHLYHPPYFQNTYVLEPLQEKHQSFIQNNSKEVHHHQLTYPDHTPPPTILSLIHKLKKDHEEIWLLTHSEPDSEIEQLYQYAKDTVQLQQVNAKFLLLTQGSFYPSESIHRSDIYPVYPVFSYVDKIVSAGGFNTVHQASFCRQKHFNHAFSPKI